MLPPAFISCYSVCGEADLTCFAPPSRVMRVTQTCLVEADAIRRVDSVYGKETPHELSPQRV